VGTVDLLFHAKPLAKVIQIMNLPEDIQSVPHGNGPRTELDYRLQWERVYLRKGGAIDSSERSVWFTTPAGQAMTEADMKKIVRQVQGMHPKHRPAPNDAGPAVAFLGSVAPSSRTVLSR